MAAKVAVIGAGEMGHGIAELLALHGYTVSMRDIKQEYIDRGMERLRWSLDKLVEKAQVTRQQADEALARIHPTLDVAEACRDADVVIEAAGTPVARRDAPELVQPGRTVLLVGSTRPRGPVAPDAERGRRFAAAAREVLDAVRDRRGERRLAVDHRHHGLGRHHLGIEQGVRRQPAMEHPAMPVGPLHHRR